MKLRYFFKSRVIKFRIDIEVSDLTLQNFELVCPDGIKNIQSDNQIKSIQYRLKVFKKNSSSC